VSITPLEASLGEASTPFKAKLPGNRLNPHISKPCVAGTKVVWRATSTALAASRTFSHAGLGNICFDSVARNSALIPMVSHALPWMQWAFVGAKRLECGSLLPLCFFSMRKQLAWNQIGTTLQTTCLSPYWPHWIVPLTPMVFHALPRMQWALAGAKRLECGGLPPLCLHAQTTCLSPYGLIRSRR